MTSRCYLPACVGALLIAVSPSVQAGEPNGFGALKAVPTATAQTQAAAWLQAATKADAATVQKVQALWADADRPVLETVAATLALADADAAKLLASAADANVAAPKEVPALLKDKSRPAFFRANLSLAYARELTSRRVFEEALDTLKDVKPEEVVDPAAYYFHKAVAEYGLVRKEAAAMSILRLLDDVSDVPQRYKAVAELMVADMKGWKKDERDLAHIARLMDNIERRLDLSRGGKVTQEIQKKVVFRLDELIKDLENQCKGSCNSQCNSGNCPSGGQPQAKQGNSNKPSSPQLDSIGGTNTGPGNTNDEVVKGLAAKWGSLPEKERAKALADMTRDLPPRHREAVEEYFRALARQSNK